MRSTFRFLALDQDHNSLWPSINVRAHIFDLKCSSALAGFQAAPVVLRIWDWGRAMRSRASH